MTNKVQVGEIWRGIMSESNVRVIRVDLLYSEVLIQYVSDDLSAQGPVAWRTDEFLKCFEKVSSTPIGPNASYYLKMHGLYIEVEDDSMISFYEDDDDLHGFRSLDFAQGAVRDLPRVLQKHIEIEEQAKHEVLVKNIVWKGSAP